MSEVKNDQLGLKVADSVCVGQRSGEGEERVLLFLQVNLGTAAHFEMLSHEKHLPALPPPPFSHGKL